jgi:hypothetical protein
MIMCDFPYAHPQRYSIPTWPFGWLLAFALACSGVAGCGSDRPPLVPVSGQVLIDGKPLTLGYIRFIPENSRAAGGRLDQQGRFTLTTYTQGDGAAIGRHQVQITAIEPMGETGIKWHAPKKYADYYSSELTANIDAPTDKLVFNLSWDGKQPFTESN